jgi:hypothetical protein
MFLCLSSPDHLALPGPFSCAFIMRVPWPQDVPAWLGWGSFSQSAINAYALLRAWHVTGDQKYVGESLGCA